MGKRRVYKIKVGEKFYWYDRDLWHIVHIFNDGDDEMVVLKSWSKYKQRWCYQVSSIETLNWWFSSQTFKEVNKVK